MPLHTEDCNDLSQASKSIRRPKTRSHDLPAVPNPPSPGPTVTVLRSTSTSPSVSLWCTITPQPAGAIAGRGVGQSAEACRHACTGWHATNYRPSAARTHKNLKAGGWVRQLSSLLAAQCLSDSSAQHFHAALTGEGAGVHAVCQRHQRDLHIHQRKAAPAAGRQNVC